MAKVRIQGYESYQTRFSWTDDTLDGCGCCEIDHDVVDVPDETLARWESVAQAFWAYQEELRELYYKNQPQLEGEM